MIVGLIDSAYRLQERDQIGAVAYAEAEREARIEERDDIRERREPPVVKIRRGLARTEQRRCFEPVVERVRSRKVRTADAMDCAIAKIRRCRVTARAALAAESSAR